MITKTVIFICTFLVGSYCFAQEWSIDKLVSYGLKQSPRLKAAELKRESSELDVSIAKSSYYPSLDLTSKHGLMRTDPNTMDRDNTSEFAITLNQSLFNNFKDHYSVEAAKAENSRLVEVSLETRSGLIRDTYLAVFEYSTKLQTLKNAEEKHSLISAQFRQLEKSYKAGFKPQTDYLRFKAQFQKSKIKIERLKIDLKSIQDEIKKIIGYEENNELAIKAIVPNFKSLPKIGELSVDEKAHYSIKQSLYAESRENNRSAVARKNDQIDIQFNLEANYGAEQFWQYPDRSVSDVDQSSWSAYLALNYNIFDAKKGANQFEKAVRQKLLAKEQLRESQINTRLLLKSLRRNISFHKQTASLNQELYKLEQSNFNLLKTKYQQGQVNILELVTALENLESSKNAYVQSYFEILGDKCKLWFHQRKFENEISFPI